MTSKEFLNRIRKSRRLKPKHLIKALLLMPIRLIFLPLEICLLISIRILSPFLLIRFGRITSWRLGHFAGNLEVYLCEMKANINIPNKKFVDFWYYPTKPTNTQLAKMWNKKLNIIRPGFVIDDFTKLNKLFAGYEKFLIETPNLDRDINHLFHSTKANLEFTAQEVQKGKEILQKFGLSEKDKFVCISVRDRSFLLNSDPYIDWSRHDFRNADFEDFNIVLTYLINKGYFVFRVGKKVEKRASFKHERFIDYPFSPLKSDFMDIFLGCYCDFCISTPNGFDAVPWIFRRPILFVNTAAIGFIRSFSKDSISTFKKYWDVKLKKFLTLIEISRRNLAYLETTEDFKINGIKLIPNSSNELLDATKEMVLRLENKWIDTEENKILQDKLRKFLVETDIQQSSSNINRKHGKIHFVGSSSFLLRNQKIL